MVDHKNKTSYLDPDWADEVADVERTPTPNHKDMDDVEKRHRVKLSDLIVDDLSEDESADPYFGEDPLSFKTNPFADFDAEDKVAAFLKEKEECKAPFTGIEWGEHKFAAHRTGFDERIRKNLANGKVPYEAKIDLHGFREEEAWGALTHFLNRASDEGVRCVLVVHGKGKGYGEGGGMGIIKFQVCGWLQASPKVLAYHTAQAKHGGSGAVYVMLRRNK